MRALIMDDSSFARNRLRALLQERGIECCEAGDGRAAMDILHGGTRFDLAFVDWNMPVMDGLEMLRQLRAEPYQELKAIMVTAEGNKRSILCALNAGADEYLMKPFDKQALSDKLALLGIGAANDC
jgi:two-component system, chemotaxis family, chemotaxis protein CheY